MKTGRSAFLRVGRTELALAAALGALIPAMVPQATTAEDFFRNSRLWLVVTSVTGQVGEIERVIFWRTAAGSSFRERLPASRRTVHDQ